MIIESRGSKVFISSEMPSAAYPAASILVNERPAPPAIESAGHSRVTVEIFRVFGGMTARALVGGEIIPSRSTEGIVRIEVLVSDRPLSLGRPAWCLSALGSPLVAGLPVDFAPTVSATMAEWTRLPDVGPIGAGIIRVDRAGHDEVGSSNAAFRHASQLLSHVLLSTQSAVDPLPTARTIVAAW